MTKDIQRAILRACARFIGKKVEPVEKRLTAIEQTTAELITKGEIAALRDSVEKRIAEVQQVKVVPGPPGPPGEPGQDGEPVLVTDVVKELLATDALVPILDLMVAEAVAKHFEENPIRHGKDGERGSEGAPGAKGDSGADGKDGIGLAGAMIDRDGALVVTLTNGEHKALGQVVGKDGGPGKDGADFTDVEFDYDGERGLIIRGNGGEIVKRLPIPIDRGYWRDGMKAQKADVLTQDGSAWIALKDTDTKPCHEHKDDWRMLARKGRDGDPGKAGKPYAPPEPVKLGASNG